jgi:hypothetical protein
MQRQGRAGYLARVIAIFDDPLHGAARFVQVWRVAVEPAHSSLGVGDDACERLVHFVGDRGGQFSQRRHARDASEFGLRLTVSPLALAEVLLRLLPLGQIEHEGDALISFPEDRRVGEDHAGAIFPQLLLLERFDASRRPELCHRSRRGGQVNHIMIATAWFHSVASLRPLAREDGHGPEDHAYRQVAEPEKLIRALPWFESYADQAES